jgi:proteasome lid subunit RPN8/RPN11
LSTPFRLLLPRRFYDAMVRQAIAELPNESCGVLAGVLGGTAVRAEYCYPLPNAAASPTEFWSEERSMLAVHKDMRKAGWEIVAVYHSHPTSAAVPSRTDRERNYSAEVMNLIISLQGEIPEMRGWFLTDQESREGEWGLTE